MQHGHVLEAERTVSIGDRWAERQDHPVTLQPQARAIVGVERDAVVRIVEQCRLAELRAQPADPAHDARLVPLVHEHDVRGAQFLGEPFIESVVERVAGELNVGKLCRELRDGVARCAGADATATSCRPARNT